MSTKITNELLVLRVESGWIKAVRIVKVLGQPGHHCCYQLRNRKYYSLVFQENTNLQIDHSFLE